ncbi:Wadjet anti-phage system protein JetA family protein [Bosea caraganae]|uniref:Wadjet anti-phage system protein JetA family protein n=1 Tax=Bosea caraganae TaxID=2763117 RepID=UPI003CCC66C4
MAACPELWREDETPVSHDQVLGRRGRRLRRRWLEAVDEAATTDAMARARHIYARLIDTGWLEESRYGLRVTVDMPSGAMRLLEFLCLLREGVSEELGGLTGACRCSSSTTAAASYWPNGVCDRDH